MRAQLNWTLFLRESRGARGRLLYFVVCLALGVGAVTAVSALVSAVNRNLRSESRELIAADIKVNSRAPLPEGLDERLIELEVDESCATHELATMLAVPTDVATVLRASRLVELKSAGAGYPFYGELVTDPPGLHPGVMQEDEALVADDLFAALELAVGDRIQLGGEDFRVCGALVEEPDRLEFGFTLGPRVLISEAGLARTELLTFGSRVQYTRLLRFESDLEAKELARRKRQLADGLETTERVRIQTHQEAQPSVRRWLRNVERYLGLVALLSLLLGGVGVAQVVRVWIEERTPAVAIQRSLGLRPREILQLYSSHVLGLAAVASSIGCAWGALTPLVAGWFFPDLFDGDASLLPPFTVILRGFGLGIVIAAIFALGPLTAIYEVSPARVLRSEAAPLPMPRAVTLFTWVVLLAGIFASTWIQSEDVEVAGIFTGGLLGLVVVLLVAARGVLWVATKVPRDAFGVYLRYGLSSLARPGAGTTATIVALGLGVHVIASMLLVEDRLARELEGGLPDEAPSVFLVDVQPDQWEPIQSVLATHGAENIDSTPVAMARLSHVGGRPVRELASERKHERGRARWVLTREQRLTWSAELSETNTLVEGEWFRDDDVAEISLETRFAEDLGAEIGTHLTFDMQGVPLEFVVTSLREVDWASFSINFFLIVEPGFLEEAPHSRLASARIETAGEQPLQDALVSEFRNVTLLRLRPMMEKVAGILERIALGVRALGWVAVLAGLAILSGAVAAGGMKRRREVALQKTLGMTRQGVMMLLGIEYGMIGLVAGLCGATASYVLSWAFLSELLELDPDLPWLWLPLFIVGSAILASACGLSSSLRAISTRPAASLRG